MADLGYEWSSFCLRRCLDSGPVASSPLAIEPNRIFYSIEKFLPRRSAVVQSRALVRIPSPRSLPWRVSSACFFAILQANDPSANEKLGASSHPCLGQLCWASRSFPSLNPSRRNASFPLDGRICVICQLNWRN